MGKIEKLLPFFLSFLFLLVYFAIIADSYKNPEKIIQNFFVDPVWMLAIILLINFLVVLKQQVKLAAAFIKFNNLIIFPVSSLAGTLLATLSFFSPPNAVYSILPVNPGQLIFLSSGSLLALIINSNFITLRKNFKILLFLSPAIVFLYFLMVRLLPNDIFMEMVKEDRLVENSQFFVLFFSAILSGATAKILLNKNRALAAFYIIATLGLIFIAGDEISWGQRLFGVETPQNISQVNSQQETNIHNLYPVLPFTRLFYILLGFYGAFSHFLLPALKNVTYRDFFIVPNYLFLYFFPIGFYNLLFTDELKRPFGEWSEVTELYFYAGMLVFITFIYFRSKLLKE